MSFIRRSAAVGMAAALLFGTVSNAFAAVWTDQRDYAPGSVVTISGDTSNGAGYLAGETVHVDVSGPNGYTSACDAVADNSGAWSCQVTLWDSALAGGDYAYIATGLTSGVTESGTFTDTPSQYCTALSAASSSSTLVSLGGTVTVTGTLSMPSSGTGCVGGGSLAGPHEVRLEVSFNGAAFALAASVNADTSTGAVSYLYTAAAPGLYLFRWHLVPGDTNNNGYANAIGASSSTVYVYDLESYTPDSACATQTDSFAQGDTVCAMAYALPNGFRGSIEWYDGGNTLQNTSSFTSDLTGNAASDTYIPPTCGTWTTKLYDNAATPNLLDTDTFDVTDCAAAVTPTLTTEVRDASDDSPGTSFAFGTSVYDHASVDSGAEGSIGFELFKGSNCTDLAGVSVASGSVGLVSGTADSGASGALTDDTYYFVVDYTSSDTDQWLDTSTCEEFSVSAAAVTPTFTTAVHDSTDDSSGTSFPLGRQVYDQLTAVDPSDAEGQVSFELWQGGDCTSLGGTLISDSGPFDLPATLPLDSDTYFALHADSYYIAVVFETADGAQWTNATGCEEFTIDPADTTTTTEVHDAAHNPITATAPGDVHDSATVDTDGYAGFDLDPIPSNVHFTLYDNSSCDGNVLQTDAKLASGTPPQTVESTPYTAVAGSYSYEVAYDGNTDYNGSTSDCESFTVAPPNTISDLSDVHAWVGLKNSDDQGTNFDLKVELYDGSTLVASGLQRCVTGLTRNATLAKDVAITWGAFAPFTVNSGETLSLKLSTRIGTTSGGARCGAPASHSNARGIRLYYDAVSRPSRFDATIGGADSNYYLRSDGNACGQTESTGVTTRYLSQTASSATAAKCKDSAGINFLFGNVWQEIGTWYYTLP